jgi:hypothetical protein
MRLSGNMKALVYQQMVAASGVIEWMNERYGENAWVYQDDGASPHRAKSTKQFLNNRCLTLSSKLHWPAHSPDLNVIENLWAILKSKIIQYQSKTSEDLWTAAQLAWNEITIEEINHLIEDFDNRLKCVEALGGQSLNGHRDVQRMLRTGHTIEEIQIMREEEHSRLSRFIDLSNQFFEPESWRGITCEERIRNSIEIVTTVLPEAVQQKVGMTEKNWSDLLKK